MGILIICLIMRNHDYVLFLFSAIWYFTVSTNEQCSSFHIWRHCCKQGHFLFFFSFLILTVNYPEAVWKQCSGVPAGWLGVWLACLSESSETWFTLKTCPIPQYAYSPIVYDSWLYLCWGGGGYSRLCISVGWSGGQEHIWFTGSFVCGVSLLCFTCRNLRAHTHSLARVHTFTSMTCCYAPALVARKANPAHWRTPTQTNKHTCCSWQVALTISRRRKGKQNKQFNLHDSSPAVH